MHTCPNCYRLTKEKPSICSRCGYGKSKYKYEKKPYVKKTDNTTISPKTELNSSDTILADLRIKGKKAVASRDKWKRTAEDAETKIKALENKILKLQTTGSNSKFKMVKNKFSQMYHPDKIMGDRFEKMIKQEIFKEFWQEIKIIEDN